MISIISTRKIDKVGKETSTSCIYSSKHTKKAPFVIKLLETIPIRHFWNHIASETFHSDMQISSELLFWPIQIDDESVQGVQFPINIFGSCTAISEN